MQLGKQTNKKPHTTHPHPQTKPKNPPSQAPQDPQLLQEHFKSPLRYRRYENLRSRQQTPELAAFALLYGGPVAH